MRVLGLKTLQNTHFNNMARRRGFEPPYGVNRNTISKFRFVHKMSFFIRK